MKRRETISPDLTPLIDVVFLLLIFFMVSTVFKTNEKAFNLTLPSTSAQNTAPQTNQILIELSSDGLAKNGKITDIVTLEGDLANISNKNQIVITLRIDAKTAYENVAQLVEMIGRNGFENLVFVSK